MSAVPKFPLSLDTCVDVDVPSGGEITEHREDSEQNVQKQLLGDYKPGDKPDQNSQLNCIYRGQQKFQRFLSVHSKTLQKVTMALLLLTYMGYFFYCMSVKFGDEPSIRMLLCTIVGLLLIFGKALMSLCPKVTVQGKRVCVSYIVNGNPKVKKVLKWCINLLSLGGALALLIIDVMPTQPRNLMCLAGLAVLLLFAFLLSKTPGWINWHTVFWGMTLQFWLAVLVKRTTVGASMLRWSSQRFLELLEHTDAGSLSVFGPRYMNFRFIFQASPTIIFFSVIIRILYHWGVVQLVIIHLGRWLAFILSTGHIESVNAAANMFLSLVEAPILIQPFLKDLSQAEMFAVLTGGFASIAGSVLGAFSAFGAPAEHLLAASVMSAPAALAFAKLIHPNTHSSTQESDIVDAEDIGSESSLTGAISTGTSLGLKVAVQIILSLLVYVALMDLVDSTFLWLAQRGGFENFNFSSLLGFIFYPLMYVMGFEPTECLQVGKLFGQKLLTTNQGAYMQLGTLITNQQKLQDYAAANGSWYYVNNNDILLERSGILATYMLCGLSNLGALGVAVTSLSSLSPGCAKDVFKLAPLALVAGNMASLSTACVAGLLC